jgi:hypothetical protein
MRRFPRSLAAALIGGAVAMAAMAIGGAVFAASEGSDGSSGFAGGAAAGLRHRIREGRPHLLAGAVHVEGSWQLKDGSTRESSFDVGSIRSVGPESISLVRLDGEEVTIAVEPGVCIRRDGEPAMLSDLEVGARSVVVQADGSALIIRSGLPHRHRDRERPRPGCGLLASVVHGELTVQDVDGSTRQLAFDAGTITAIADADLTIRREDDEMVSLSWDADTVVLDAGEIRTVDDLSVGERAMFLSEDGSAILVRCVREGTST